MKLFDYQETGRDFLAARTRGYLADVPGLGKTAQASRAALELGLNPYVICPAVAVPVWQEEWAKWGGRPFDLGVTSYTMFTRSRLQVTEPFDLVILDEAHYCKTPSAKRTRAALGVARQARRTWLLSGSPMPNDPRELWPTFKYLWPERVPNGITTAWDWMDFFCTWYMGPYGPKITGVKNGPTLRKMLDGIMLRRHLKDVGLELPPLRLHTVPLPADPKFAAELASLGEIETSTGRRLLGAHKAPRIAKQIVQEMTDDRAYREIVVMYHHRDTGRLLREMFDRAGLEVWGFGGSATVPTKAKEVAGFQRSKKRRAFVVQQMSGGTAITLTASSEIVLVEPDWSPEVNAQAIKRVHRISQTDPVRARVFAVDGSLDQAVLTNLARKIEMRVEVFNG